MAKRKHAEPAHEPAHEPVSRENERAFLMAALQQGKELLAREFAGPWQLDDARRERKLWRDGTATLLSQIFNDETVGMEFAEITTRFSDRPSVLEEFEEFRDSMQTYVTRLQAIVKRFDPSIETDSKPRSHETKVRLDGAAETSPKRRKGADGPVPSHATEAKSNGAGAEPRHKHGAAEAAPTPPAPQTSLTPPTPPTPAAPPAPPARIPARAAGPGEVLIVDGGGNGTGTTIAALAKELGLPAVLGTERGRMTVEEIEQQSAAAFAVLVMTAENGNGANGAKPDAPKPASAARQSFEIGFLAGRLGRKKVCVLKEPGAAIPADWDGVVFIDFDPFGAWRFRLAKEMRGAGLAVDLNRLA